MLSNKLINLNVTLTLIFLFPGLRQKWQYKQEKKSLFLMSVRIFITKEEIVVHLLFLYIPV